MQLKLDKLKELKKIESNNLSELMSSLTCNNERSDSCMLGLCTLCKTTKLPTLDYNPSLISYYYKCERVEETRTNEKGENYSFQAMAKRKIGDHP